MRHVWPGRVSLVVPRGDWLAGLGLGTVAGYIGTDDSIASMSSFTLALPHTLM
jgi:hypothetical protein